MNGNVTIKSQTPKLLEDKDFKSTPAKTLTCQICLQTFSTQELVNKHAESHYANSGLTFYFKLSRPYKCEECDVILTKKQLMQHHRLHLNINPFVCTELNCKYVGNNKDAFRRHKLVHSPLHVCEECGAMFHRRGSLRQHHARAHLPAPAQCPQCGVTCKNELTFAAHLTAHNTQPRFACPVAGCGKAHRSKFAAAQHARAHADRRVYACHLCIASYTSQSLLNRHVRQHEIVKARRCDRCPRVFTDYSQLYIHRVNKHGPWRPYRCRCATRFEKESHLEKHQLSCEVAIRMQTELGQTDERMYDEEMSDSEDTVSSEICINKVAEETEDTGQDDVSEELYIVIENEDSDNDITSNI